MGKARVRLIPNFFPKKRTCAKKFAFFSCVPASIIFLKERTNLSRDATTIGNSFYPQFHITMSCLSPYIDYDWWSNDHLPPLLEVEAIGGRGSEVNFLCEIHMKVPITGVLALFTECQNSALSGKYGSFNFWASILCSKIWWKIATKISFLRLLNEKYSHLSPSNSYNIESQIDLQYLTYFW